MCTLQNFQKHFEYFKNKEWLKTVNNGSLNFLLFQNISVSLSHFIIVSPWIQNFTMVSQLKKSIRYCICCYFTTATNLSFIGTACCHFHCLHSRLNNMFFQFSHRIFCMKLSDFSWFEVAYFGMNVTCIFIMNICCCFFFLLCSFENWVYVRLITNASALPT